MAGGRDHYFRNANGAIIVREGGEAGPWLVTWLPDDADDRAYPGFTLSSTIGEVPEGPTVEAVVGWAGTQPWANRRGGQAAPAVADKLDVPADEWADLKGRAFEHSRVLGITREPDGSFSWGLATMDGEILQSGVEDTWDDARMAVILNLYPPSEEGRGTP